MSRRFIAGARCQACGAEDSLYLDSESVDDRVCCVDCAFTETRPAAVTAAAPQGPDEIVRLKFPMT
ncbi:MAG: YheV family putative metal-binding protein [Pseudomonadales bacterium]|jgi:uncharacterized metal-binding protein (TIGR02443 family)